MPITKLASEANDLRRIKRLVNAGVTVRAACAKVGRSENWAYWRGIRKPPTNRKAKP
jgi:hypothetical protein